METVLSIVKTVSLLGGLIVVCLSVIKYFQEKNRDIYLKRLNLISAPLLRYLVRQETVRSIYMADSSRAESPILTMSDEKNTIFTRDELLEIFHSTEAGIINPYLLTLLSKYEIFVKLEDGGFITKELGMKKVEIENEIFNEIVKQYKELIQKLKLKEYKEIPNLDNFIL